MYYIDVKFVLAKVLMWPLSCLHMTGIYVRGELICSFCYFLTDLRCTTTSFVPFRSYKSMVGDMLASKLLSSGDIILNICTHYPSYRTRSRHYPKLDVFYRIGRNTSATTTSFGNKFFSSNLEATNLLTFASHRDPLITLLILKP